MKKLYTVTVIKSILLVFFALYGNQVLGDTQGFNDFGYPKQTMALGPKNSSIFFFKQRNDLQHEGSFVHIELVGSKALDKDKSKILFFINDLPVLSSSLDVLNDTLKVDLPLRTEDFESGYLKLEIKSDLFKSNDECRDFSDPDYWLKITSRSHLYTNLLSQFSIDKKTKTLDELIPDMEKLVIPRTSDLKLSQFASYLHFLYMNRFGVDLAVSYLDEISLDSLDRALIVGVWDKLPNDLRQDVQVMNGQGDLKILNKEVTDSLTNFQYYTSNIVLTSRDFDGIEKVVQFLFDKDLLKSTFSEHLKVNQSLTTEVDFKYILKPEFLLEELGLQEEMIYGSCRIVKNIQLPRFLTNNDLKLLSFQLKVNHKPVRKGEEGYINIYLNNSLLQTYAMDESGIVDKLIRVKSKPIRAGSYFSVEYVYLSEGKCCGETGSEFFAQIDPRESKIKIESTKNLQPIFSAFPENFSGNRVQVLTDIQITKNEIPAMSNLINQINIQSNLQDMVYLPEFLSLNDSSFQNTNRSNIILITHQPQKYNVLFEDNQFIKFYKDSISYQSDELETFFTVNYNKDLTYAQIFKRSQKMILMIAHLSDDSRSLFNVIKGIHDPYLTNSGNVLLANDQHYYFFDLRDKVSSDQKSEKKEIFESFWDQYKLFIIIMLLALIVVLLTYIFRKSELAKTQIEDARK
ncbi:cellulose biosynthesis cyclic di-GMP-binding regulatory protein BcsB [Belliella sp. R4-6]|uniref:Cellulose biosynthesis cyclic di-GMP-binding regulatory protein BcsB n=1 Tax=Belliella alkalica TaxID=1730871 RepID=A0ABS9V7X1_9BACT|nr:cellulose biosynthesis cyclic di-GMP-binding regulatory protein BcsB [Belliella alkalica]MCH7412504.1 cellulose biosynthesis cyclic di-GMP-binding regulatory protein BcsB [Belliella alkalica]